ncbi:uncharacterized protein LOC126824901 [Patella vulgata]|uniref:uncharacterized protein LOC126824901 n=1 Tax=Patella vulgata TaxID=6465 RepID=UPI00218032C6|nr:uncharacterized protein LOC126824901 [Patella vulgata]
MWTNFEPIKLLSNTFSALSKPKLLRLDSTGEVSSENSSPNCEFTPPPINILTKKDNMKSQRNFGNRRVPIMEPYYYCNGRGGGIHTKPLNGFGVGGCQELMQKSPFRSLNKKTMNITGTSDFDQGSTRGQCNYSSSFINHWSFSQGLLGKQAYVRHTSSPGVFKSPIHPDSPWLKVNSGYFHQNNFNNGAATAERNAYRKFDKKKSKHKHYSNKNTECSGARKDNKSNSVIQSAGCDPTVMEKELSAKPIAVSDSVVKDIDSVIKDSIINDKSEPQTVSNTKCEQEVNSNIKMKCEVCEQKVNFNEPKQEINCNIECVTPHPGCELSNSLGKALPFIEKLGKTNSTHSAEKSNPAHEVSKSCVGDNNRHPSPSPTKIHLNIIGKKKHKNELGIVQNKDCRGIQSEEIKPTSVLQEDKDSQKLCNICTAYITRVTPECKEFPQSAGCKHSIILLVRDNSKKTKKRRVKEKQSESFHSSPSPKSFYVGVKTAQSPIKSHIFQFVASDNDTETDDSWDSIDDDDDDNDWSNMDEMFPQNLMNPMNFKDHISTIPKQSTGTCASATNNNIESLNISWNIHSTDNKTDTEQSNCSENKTKKVHFADEDKLVVVHRMYAWSFAYRACRRGPWEQYARDRERFHRRIQDIEKIISPILKMSHRSQIYKSLHSDKQ